MKIKNRRIIDIVKALNLPRGEYAVFGSALMEIYGLRDSGDVDFIVTRKLFDELLTTESWKKFQYPNGDWALKFVGGGERGIDVAFHDCAEMPSCDEKSIRAMISRAVEIDGVMFTSWDDILSWKKNYARPKDLKDVELIEEFLKGEIK